MNTFEILLVDELDVGTAALAALILRARLARWTEISVTTAGVRALDGSGMDAPYLDVTAKVGQNGGRHTAHQLTASHIRRANLVLTSGRAERRAVALLVPRATRHLFTLKEFVRTAAALDAHAIDAAATTGDVGDRLRLIVEAVAQRRGSTPPPDDPSTEDIADPHGLAPHAYAVAGEQTAHASNAVAQLFLRGIAVRG